MRAPEEYLELPYAVVLVHDEDADNNSGWVAEVAELPGCISQGATPEEAARRLRDAMVDWIAVALEHGVAIPEPRAAGDDSGPFLVWVPAGDASA
jgi:antitoxin HicB